MNNLSSYSAIPLTEETRARLLDLGKKPSELVGLSEMTGQSILALHDKFDVSEANAPHCFTREFDPARKLCQGCLFAPQCWRKDVRYLNGVQAGEVDPPPWVGSEDVQARLLWADGRAPKPPPRKARSAPQRASGGKRKPPPKRAKRKPPPKRRKAPKPPPRKAGRKAPPPKKRGKRKPPPKRSKGGD